jgi:hypothetical protein
MTDRSHPPSSMQPPGQIRPGQAVGLDRRPLTALEPVTGVAANERQTHNPPETRGQKS